MVERKEYLDKLLSWKDDKIIKVITGMRRCGKSTLLMQYQNKIKNLGVSSEQIISINFEELEYEELLDYKKLYDYIKSRMTPSQTTYVFLDEIQKVENFEKVVDSLFVKDNIDIYITGSNSYMLSSELATYLTGRYIEVSMLPLSFCEYLQLVDTANTQKAFADYMKFGGLPYVTNLKQNVEKNNIYLEGIYNTVIVKDIEDRQTIKNPNKSSRKIADIALLQTIAKYLASVVGSIVSVKSVTNYLTSNGRKISPNTVDDYIRALTESFIFYPAERFDISGKQILKNQKKYYIVDLGIRNHILPKINYDLGFSIENITFFELIKRGYNVCIGKLDSLEVDFVARKGDDIKYIQVTADMTNEQTFQREMRSLEKINDNHEKIILTLDNFTQGNYNGVKVINIIDWLCCEQ